MTLYVALQSNHATALPFPFLSLFFFALNSTKASITAFCSWRVARSEAMIPCARRATILSFPFSLWANDRTVPSIGFETNWRAPPTGLAARFKANHTGS
ncbi:hypothetical protein B0J17DRAFT_660374 [Rhizoctonia solani]|nr:hypothetical protein B0J17DRAFT_660374 [Rhizoctonia solani]